MTPTRLLAALHSAITAGEVELIDLTAPLSASTPVLQLPEPFANTIALSLEAVSDFDDAGPMWKWHNIHTGEHTGTHVDAPAHWVTGKDGWSIDQVPPERLVGPAVVVDVTAEVAEDADFLLQPEHLETWEQEHERIPDGAWVLLRTGWSARGGSQDTFLNADDQGPHTPGHRSPPPDGSRRSEASAATGWRRWASTPALRAAWNPVPRALLLARRGQARSDPAAAARPTPRHRRPADRAAAASGGRHR